MRDEGPAIEMETIDYGPPRWLYVVASVVTVVFWCLVAVVVLVAMAD